MVDFSPCLLMHRCPIVALDFLRYFLMSFSVMPKQVFRKPFLTALRKLVVVGPKSVGSKYWDSSGLEVCARILFTTFYNCCVPRGTYHIIVLFFLVTLIIYLPFLWIDSSCLSSIMLHPSSHKTPNDINGAAYIFGKMWICLACLIRSGIWSVATCEDAIVLPSSSLAFISFDLITGAIVGVDCFDRCMFAPESAIDIMLLLI